MSKRFGDILLEAGRIDQVNLERALLLQAEEPGTRIGEMLLRIGLVGPADIARALSAQFGLATQEREQYPEFPILEEQIATRFLREARVLPIAEDAEHVIVAMVDPQGIEA